MLKQTIALFLVSVSQFNSFSKLKKISFIPSGYGNATRVAPRLAGKPIPYVKGTYGKKIEPNQGAKFYKFQSPIENSKNNRRSLSFLSFRSKSALLFLVKKRSKPKSLKAKFRLIKNIRILVLSQNFSLCDFNLFRLIIFGCCTSLALFSL